MCVWVCGSLTVERNQTANKHHTEQRTQGRLFRLHGAPTSILFFIFFVFLSADAGCGPDVFFFFR